MEPKQFARKLRQEMTDAERLLWRHLRAHRLAGEKFRRQQPLGPYIADFVHFGARLVIEVDGGQHNGSGHDRRRDAWLDAQGFKVLRFWNDDVLLRTEAVLAVIWGELSPSPPAPLPSRERGASATPPSPLAGAGPGERGHPNTRKKPQ
ncbi:endonuclease domain-containing protein [Sterolibacterium denitrificans]|nr:endonuclease domain-containing protein [Sterolibacterium denitrificans]